MGERLGPSWLSFTLRRVSNILDEEECRGLTRWDVDKSTVLDNDESLRSSWTNWCGPTPSSLPYLSQKQCSDLSRCLAHLSSTSSRHFDRSLPSHVFQILDIEGSVLVSFPEEGYDPENYAGMAREVVKRPKGVEEATTSCTRRYRSKHPVYVPPFR